jgi:hypothetical protein
VLYVTEESNVSSITQNPPRWKHFTNILLESIPKQYLTIDMHVILTFIGYNQTWWYHRLPLWQSTAHLLAILLFVQFVWFPGLKVELQMLHLVEGIPLSHCSTILSQNEWMIALSTNSKVFRLWFFILLLPDCITGTTQKLPFGIHTTIELKNLRTTLGSTVTHLSQNIPRQTPFLSDVVVIFLRSILVLTTNGQFLEYADIAFSEL